MLYPLVANVFNGVKTGALSKARCANKYITLLPLSVTMSLLAECLFGQNSRRKINFIVAEFGWS